MPSGRKEGVCVCVCARRFRCYTLCEGQLALQSILQLTATNELHIDGQREYQV